MRPDRVLIVDDDGATRRGLAQLLAQAGYEATAVGTFDEARRIIGATPPDLLITDIRLEAYNGLQLILNSPRTDSHHRDHRLRRSGAGSGGPARRGRLSGETGAADRAPRSSSARSWRRVTVEPGSQ